ncbi:hypothetical protein ZWY2020_041841 [Hordeum vulgare]|nr:hypothetical protein ZWY2020_041841 [Hordeum vulgare]
MKWWTWSRPTHLTGVMEYVMCFLRRNASVEVENALLSSMVESSHYTGCAIPTVGANKQIGCL